MSEQRVTFDWIFEAASGDFGEDAQRLAVTGLSVVDLLLRKNSDYGSSAWNRPCLLPGLDAKSALQVRMSDKVERLKKLLASDQKALVAESIDDTVRDLAGYAILWLACPE